MTWQSELDYIRQLAIAGLDGIAAARRELQGPVFEPSPTGSLWTPAVVCAGLGMVRAGSPPSAPAPPASP